MKNGNNKTIGLAFISVFEKILGLVKNLLFSLMYGTSGISDAFNIALTIPDTFYSLFGSGVNSSFIPLYHSRKDEHKNSFTSETINAVTVLTIIVASVGAVFSNQIVSIFAPGFDKATHILTVSLVRISVWSVVITAICNILISFLQIKNAFLSSGMTPVALNIVQCVGIVFSYYYGYYWLAIGILIGYLVQLVILVVLAAKNGYIYTPVIPEISTIKEILVLSLPIFLSASVNRLNLLIDKAVASSITEGGVSALAYADNLILFIKGIFGMPFITVAFPTIATIIATKKSESLNRVIDSYMEGILFYIIPITVGCMCLDAGIVSLVYKRGAFNSQSVLMTSGCLAWYAIGLPAFCIRDLLVKIFYAKKDSKTPTINMFIGIGLNIVLNFILSYFFGLKGLALASSVSAYLIAILLYYKLKKNNDYILGTPALKQIGKILVATIVMLASISLIKRLFGSHIIISTLVCTCVGFFVYITTLLCLRSYSIGQLKRMLLMQNKNL